MTSHHSPPIRVLIVTPEITVVPQGMGPGSAAISARAGGLGDICAAQTRALCEQGVDVHLAMPNYRNLFRINARQVPDIDIPRRNRELPQNRIHLAQDRCFYYHPKLFLSANEENIRIALAFQREVINRIIPEVQPDLIHCFDWMTGLIPAMARKMGIACIFQLYRLDSPKLLLSTIEEQGIDAAAFWQHCFYSQMPGCYEETRHTNPLDLLSSGVFAAHSVMTFRETFQNALTDTRGGRIESGLKAELVNKMRAGRLCALSPAPDPSFNPANDHALMRRYGPETHYPCKLFNKLHLQEILGLRMDTSAPLCIWPTRLDASRPGCRLIDDALAPILERYLAQHLQLVFVADGDYQSYLRSRIERLQATRRVAVCDFDARRFRLAFAGSDFVLMPLRSDPVALPCKIGQRYGSLPIAYDGGAIHDCVAHLDANTGLGNGFLFRHFDLEGFMWALEQAVSFYRQPIEMRTEHVRRIMVESLVRFDPETWIQQIIDRYARVVQEEYPGTGTPKICLNNDALIAA